MQTNSTATPMTVNADERAEYFISELRSVASLLTFNPRKWQLWVSVSLGELTSDDAEYIGKRAKERSCRHVVHTESEVDRDEFRKAMLQFNLYDIEGREKEESTWFIVEKIDQMKELICEAETLRSLYPKQATTPQSDAEREADMVSGSLANQSNAAVGTIINNFNFDRNSGAVAMGSSQAKQNVTPKTTKGITKWAVKILYIVGSIILSVVALVLGTWVCKYLGLL